MNLKQSQERIARADGIYHPSPEQLKRILEHCERARADYEFRKDAKIAVSITAGAVFLGCLWWIVNILSGGSW